MTRDMNVLDRFCAVTNRKQQAHLAVAVSKLTKEALEDGFALEDIIACLTYIVEAEAEVTADTCE